MTRTFVVGPCYRQGFGGVRLEDLLLVTEDGSEVLTSYSHELEP